MILLWTNQENITNQIDLHSQRFTSKRFFFFSHSTVHKLRFMCKLLVKEYSDLVYTHQTIWLQLASLQQLDSTLNWLSLPVRERLDRALKRSSFHLIPHFWVLNLLQVKAWFNELVVWTVLLLCELWLPFQNFIELFLFSTVAGLNVKPWDIIRDS